MIDLFSFDTLIIALLTEKVKLILIMGNAQSTDMDYHHDGFAVIVNYYSRLHCNMRHCPFFIYILQKLKINPKKKSRLCSELQKQLCHYLYLILSGCL